MRIGPKGLEFREAVAMSWTGKPKTGRLRVEIVACPPDHRCRDIDNVLKASLDALQHAGLFADDNQIDVIHITRGQVQAGGELRVRITELSPE